MHQEKSTYGLGYKLTKTKNSDNSVFSVLNKADATNNGIIKKNGIDWLPHYTLSMEQQTIISKQILSQSPTELQYVETSVFMTKVNTQNLEF